MEEDFSFRAMENHTQSPKIIWDKVPTLISKELDEKLPTLISKTVDEKFPAILDAFIKKNFAEFFRDRLHLMSTIEVIPLFIYLFIVFV